MTTQPFVELLVGDLDPRTVTRLDQRALGTAEELISSALASHRLLVINYAKREVMKLNSITGVTLGQLLDLAGEMYLGRLNSVLGPAAATAYIRAYRDVGAGDVPMSTIYALADEHTKRIGRYYNETSKEALLQGFNTYANRQLPARVAAERALDGFGLTPRQMNGYTSLEAARKVNSAQPRSLKAKALEYIGRSIRSRLKIFSEQEAHNLDQQAKQTAWLWMQQHGGLTENAQKVWLTARDERTCPTCAPMHGTRVLVTERFELPNGLKVWVAGVHPNCRCEIRVIDAERPDVSVQKSLVSKAGEKWYEDELKRTSDGRFARSRANVDRQRAAAAQLRELRDRPRTQFKEPTGDVLPTELLPPEAEETVDLSSALSSQVDLRRSTGVDLRGATRGVDLSGALNQQVDLSSTVDLAQSKVSLSDETKVDLRNRIHDAVRMHLRMAPPEPFRPTKRDGRKIKYSPTVKLERPVYAIVPMTAIDQHGQIDLDSDVYFTADEDDVAMSASEAFEGTMTDYADYIEHNQGGQVTRKDPVTGATLYAHVDRGDIYDVLWATGFRYGDDDYPDQASVDLEWHTSDGYYLYNAEMRYQHIAEQWDISPGEMDVAVVRLSEGHDSSLGQTTQEEAATGYGYEYWSTTGKYNTTESHRVQFDTHVPVQIYDLTPDVEVEELEPLLDEWNE